MKKQLYLLTAGLLTVCIAKAQIKKGDILLGGNVGFSLQHSTPGGNDKSTQTNYAISPSIGKAVQDNLLVGLNLNYAHTKSKFTSTPDYGTKQNVYGLGVFVRKYKVLGAGFAIFGEGDLGGQYTQTRNYVVGSPDGPANKTIAINAGFYPGLAYFISRHVQLETGIQNLAYVQYSHNKNGTSPAETKTDNFGIGTNLSQAFDNLVVGIKWVL